MNTRQALIAELADDIACGTPSGKFSAAFFLDTLMDDQRVTADDVAVLLTMSELSDAHEAVSDRVRDLVEQEAIEFFTNDERGQDHINEQLAAREQERLADEEYERKYGEVA